MAALELRKLLVIFFFFNDPAAPEIYPLSLPGALPIPLPRGARNILSPAATGGQAMRRARWEIALRSTSSRAAAAAGSPSRSRVAVRRWRGVQLQYSAGEELARGSSGAVEPADASNRRPRLARASGA